MRERMRGGSAATASASPHNSQARHRMFTNPEAGNASLKEERN
jgi:hypothetical protein